MISNSDLDLLSNLLVIAKNYHNDERTKSLFLKNTNSRAHINGVTLVISHSGFFMHAVPIYTIKIYKKEHIVVYCREEQITINKFYKRMKQSLGMSSVQMRTYLQEKIIELL